MREVPVKLAGAAVDRAGLQVPVFVASHRLDLAEVTGVEDLVGFQQLPRLDGALLDRDAVLLHQADHPLPGDAVEKRAVGYRRDRDAVLDEDRKSTRLNSSH